MEPNNPMNQAPPRAQRPQRRPCFIRLSDHEHLVLPLHTVPQLFINPPHLPRVHVDVQQELTPARDNTQYRLRVMPTLGDMPAPLLPNDNEMKILAWNCRGIARSNFLPAIGTLLDRHEPHILILMNTRHLEDGELSSSHAIRQQLPYSNSYMCQVGRFWVLWNGGSLIICRFVCSPRELHLEVVLPPRLPLEDFG